MDAALGRASSRPTLLWLAAVKIVVLVLVFDPNGNVAFDLPKSLASRAVEWAIGAVLVYAVVAHGWGVVPRTRMHVAVLGLAAASAVATVFAAEPYIAVFGEQDRYLGLTFLGDMVVLYLAVAVAVRTAGDVTVLLGAIGLAGGLAGAYAIVQALGADPISWAVDPRSRPFSTFGNPDQFGHFISVLFGVAFGGVLGASSRARRAIAGTWAAAALGIAAIVAARGTLIGVAGALAGGGVVRRPGGRNALLAIVATLAIAGALLSTPLGQRAIETVRGYSVSDRITLYSIAAQATLARPLLGYGPDNFRAAFVGHRSAESLVILGSGPQTSAHDWLLDASATTGLIGLAVLLTLVGFGTLELLGLARAMPAVGTPLFAGWTAYWANALVDVGSVGVAWLPWVALGVAAALRGPRRGPAGRRVPPWLRIAIAIVAIIGIASGARAFLANRDAWAAAEASHFGDAEAAVALADRAAARDGGRADNWNQLGLALEGQGRWTDSAAAYRTAASREPYEPIYWANLGQALARAALAGNVSAKAEAIMAAQEAELVDPNSPIGHVALAEIAAALGRCDLARSAAARAAALEPGHDQLVARAAACR